ncbi:hypothetical protein LCGC14_1837120 [marine sediment metagenome]|uniref:Rad50/SbcC-type AAA domain-containing protein n=1 Tax=marine sediment metagenome TaxID=412755 RepID=A0A0F9GEA9_9ZZZZ
MNLIKLKAHNVFSIGNIELDLKDRGLTLVTGWSYDDNNGNMAGKSSLANHCITWGMYGKTVHGVRADAVVNSSIKNAKHCGVWIRFEGIDGVEYRIYRARKPASLNLSQKTYRVDGEEWDDLTKRNERDTQELIDKLLGRDHRTFIQSDFFGQGRERSFLALPGSEQRAVIEEILPLTSLERWNVTAKEATAEAKIRYDDEINKQLLSTERVNMCRIRVEETETRVQNWKSSTGMQIAVDQKELNDVRDISSGIEEEISTLKRALPSKLSTEQVVRLETAKTNGLTMAINNLQIKIDGATTHIGQLTSRPDICSACNQKLPEDVILSNVQVVEDTKKEREAHVLDREEKHFQLSKSNATLHICTEVEKLEAKVNLKQKEVRLETEISRLLSATNQYATMLDSAKSVLELEAKNNEDYHKIASLWHEKLEHCKFWSNAFGRDLKTLLFDQVCPYLEQTTNRYLEDLNNGQIKVRFSTERTMKSGDTKDEFCVTASSATGSSVFELFSGAEKQLTSFAVGMALSDLAGLQTEGASKFMILDEPFLYQSPENCENIVNFITQQLGGKSTILLISNEDNLAGLIPNRVHVTKTNGVSSIE